MKSRIYKIVLITACIILLFILLGFILINYINENSRTGRREIINNNLVVEVIDGDTFRTYNGSIIRLICINSPEIGEDGYEEAKNFLEGLIFGKEVKLEKDISETDNYGRKLRYVYVESEFNSYDEIFVNLELVSHGHADIMEIEPDISKCEEIKEKFIT